MHPSRDRTDVISSYTLITEAEALNDLARRLEAQPVVAVDTEANSLFAYRQQVCLLQFSTPEEDFLVDPFAIPDLSPLAPVFRGKTPLKVFHAAEYDLIGLRRDFGFEFQSIFDTMLAARILGRERIGLGALLEAEFGVRLNKRLQRANWGERPLPAELLEYASLDTHYLIPLRQRLEEELHQRGLWELAMEDFNRLAVAVMRKSTNPEDREGQEVAWWRLLGARRLTPRQAAVLQELCRYRQSVARSMNTAPFRVLGNHTLLAIVHSLPSNLTELSHLPGMTHGKVHHHGKALLEAVQRGLRNPPLYPPPPAPRDVSLRQRLLELRHWRKQQAERLGTYVEAILPRDLMVTLAKTCPTDMEQLAVILHDSPWRLEHFGPEILGVLRPWSKGRSRTLR